MKRMNENSEKGSNSNNNSNDIIADRYKDDGSD